MRSGSPGTRAIRPVPIAGRSDLTRRSVSWTRSRASDGLGREEGMMVSILKRYRPGGRLNDPGQMELPSLDGVGGVDSVVQEANMSKLTRVVLDDPDLARLWLDEQVAESRMLPEGILFSANVRVSPEVARYILDHHNKPRVVQDGNGDQEELRNR